MTPPDDILNAPEAAALLKIHVETIRRFARAGRVPAFRVGSDWRFNRGDLLAWTRRSPAHESPSGVLVVDDEESVRKLFQRILEEEDYRALPAASAKEGLAVLERERVDLIILDLEMPTMKGPEFLRRLKEMKRDIPILVVTGYPDSELMMEALKHGPLTLLAKPVDREPFMQAVRAALSQAPGSARPWAGAQAGKGGPS